MDGIFDLRERGISADMPVEFRFQNVPFVLNILDSLAGDDRFIELRKRTKTHRILEKIDDATEASRDASLKQQEDFIREATEQIEAAQKAFEEKIQNVKNQPAEDPRITQQRVETLQKSEGRKLEVQIAGLKKDRDSKVKQSERELAMKVRGVQDLYKLLAVVVPPIPPILLALMVFFHRRKAEQEGVVASRLRYGKAPGQAN
jgi:ABC-2 type transport system permease protein